MTASVSTLGDLIHPRTTSQTADTVEATESVLSAVDALIEKGVIGAAESLLLRLAARCAVDNAAAAHEAAMTVASAYAQGVR